jgi:hypothetical protein
MSSEVRKAVIKNADMSEEMQLDAVDCATAVCLFSFFFLILESKFFTKKQKGFRKILH